MRPRRSVTIVLADDDPDDRKLVEEALAESRLVSDLRFVEDGEELLAYLQHCGGHGDPDGAPRPGVILLDLDMPRMDGREALRRIKGDPQLRRIPVVVLTSSRSEADIRRCYDLGVNSYIVKPTSFAALVDIMRSLAVYWLEIVEIPGS